MWIPVKRKFTGILLILNENLKFRKIEKLTGISLQIPVKRAKFGYCITAENCQRKLKKSGNERKLMDILGKVEKQKLESWSRITSAQQSEVQKCK